MPYWAPTPLHTIFLVLNHFSVINREEAASLASTFQLYLLQFHVKKLSQQLNHNSAAEWHRDVYFPRCLHAIAPFQACCKTQHKLVLLTTTKHRQSYFLIPVLL